MVSFDYAIETAEIRKEWPAHNIMIFMVISYVAWQEQISKEWYSIIWMRIFLQWHQHLPPSLFVLVIVIVVVHYRLSSLLFSLHSIHLLQNSPHIFLNKLALCVGRRRLHQFFWPISFQQAICLYQLECQGWWYYNRGTVKSTHISFFHCQSPRVPSLCAWRFMPPSYSYSSLWLFVMQSAIFCFSWVSKNSSKSNKYYERCQKRRCIVFKWDGVIDSKELQKIKIFLGIWASQRNRR